ncbi:MAG: phosphoribosylglycinamide formyltransferase [Actinobacteria bacterium]|uniref:phosphoribosylglycinamide formyltransferase 1 n=1 Tax=freshwater metagenome TaxID=449393 RepID=A0A6J7M6T9_9ZZZZ|nr:phosphoribosylglycinamide formyltransferase [Actinomycetota bacterium]MSX45250.1 phosphoribosylglycinamide formyltransferase [Actinomycetota bacterium]MSX73212.1 phosphoribosylglycinamide formyltransferase [Actinomycetota bacterium]MSZ01021.1 phosphoribosylglycinamide formyltransferase [Actinomycetota bacterium]MTA59759.1 phosphoribosylglycinamide formyltransferase [Actinomycetota bacterium]
MTTRLVILASGSGTLAQAIVDSTELDIDIVAVISDNRDAHVLKRAHDAGIKTLTISVGVSRDQWNTDIIQAVAALDIDLVVSAGFMRILPPDFVNRFPTINSHPALLPQFPGAHAVRDALEAGVAVTGTTVHWVDDGVDTGPIITQMEVPILPGDDEAQLHERIKKVERGLIVATIALILPSLERNV